MMNRYYPLISPMERDKMKRVVVLGGGIAGCFAAIRVKELHPSYKVTIVEHNDKLLKKIYATGNGKCNFANIGSLKNRYNHEEFALNIIRDFKAEDIVNYFDGLGIKSKAIGDLIYPYSESAETVANKLLRRIEELNIEVMTNYEVIDFNNTHLLTVLGTLRYDSLIISVGGKSSPKLGSNGDLWNALLNRGFELREPHPSLCPIKTKENTKMVDGYRAKVSASLYQGKKLIHTEEGELLFKKDGLSGMVIFNMTHFINRLNSFKDVTIHIDFAKGIDGEYDALVNPKIADYLLKNKLNIHNTVFTFKDFYGYENSQVTSGGLLISELNEDLSSKKNPHIYFIGEVIDIDAVCGGFNIMWALASAEKVAKNI